MADLRQQCPFLNRSDARCSAHFRLNHLGGAFQHCFDRYQSCAVYPELLKERRDRRAAAAQNGRRGFWARGGFDAVSSNDRSAATPIGAPACAQLCGTVRAPEFTLVTVSHRDTLP